MRRPEPPAGNPPRTGTKCWCNTTDVGSGSGDASGIRGRRSRGRVPHGRLRTRQLTAQAGSLLKQLPADRFGAELQRSVVETNSRPYVRLIDLAEDLAALRRGVVAAAEPLGLGHRGRRHRARRRPGRTQGHAGPALREHAGRVPDAGPRAADLRRAGARRRGRSRSGGGGRAPRGTLAACAAGAVGELAVLAGDGHRLRQLPHLGLAALADHGCPWARSNRPRTTTGPSPTSSGPA